MRDGDYEAWSIVDPTPGTTYEVEATEDQGAEVALATVTVAGGKSVTLPSTAGFMADSIARSASTALSASES